MGNKQFGHNKDYRNLSNMVNKEIEHHWHGVLDYKNYNSLNPLNELDSKIS